MCPGSPRVGRGRKPDLKILVIHGPNLNLLGTRETSMYGSETLEEINNALSELALKLGVELSVFQSNSESAIIERIHDCLGSGIKGLVINPAAYGHTSIALRDALLATDLPFVEVHLTNVHSREEFRRKTYLSDIARGVVVGFRSKSYELGLIGLVHSLDKADGEVLK